MAGPFTTPVADSVPFLSEPDKSNGFVSKNSQDAIEEARNTAIGKVRANRTFTHNGTLGDNFWHGYSNLIDSNTTPMVIPWDCIWKEFTFSANGNSIDGRMDFYLNGTSSADIFYSVQFNNVNQTLLDFPNINLNEGDLVRVRWVDQGQNPSDVVSTFDFQLT